MLITVSFILSAHVDNTMVIINVTLHYAYNYVNDQVKFNVGIQMKLHCFLKVHI
jgi:hypothetical protein